MNFIQRHAYSIGFGFAGLLWPFFKKRQKIAIDNIIRGKVTDDPKVARKIARTSFCHFAGHIAEAIFVPYIVNKDNWREHLDFTGLCEETRTLLLDKLDVPILLVSSHHGVWEAATNMLSFARPMIAIVRMVDNKFAAKLMKKHHFRGPITMIDKNHGFTAEAIHEWENRCSAMTFLMDQFVHNGLPVKFFGRPARTYSTATRLAIRYGHPIVIGSFVRIAPYKYKLIGDKPIYLSKDSDKMAATQLLNDRLEAAIRVCPEQYLWVHRRWRDD